MWCAFARKRIMAGIFAYISMFLYSYINIFVNYYRSDLFIERHGSTIAGTLALLSAPTGRHALAAPAACELLSTEARLSALRMVHATTLFFRSDAKIAQACQSSNSLLHCLSIDASLQQLSICLSASTVASNKMLATVMFACYNDV